MNLYSNYSSLQAAVNGTADGDILQLPANPIAITAPVTITKRISIQGTNKDVSLITVPAGQDGLVISAEAVVHFSGFGLVGTYQTGSGALIRMESAYGNSIFRDLNLLYGFDQLVIQPSGSTHLVDGCWCQQYMHSGITVAGGDDHSIISCTIDSGQPNAVGILYSGTGGGLRINNTKVLGGEMSVMVSFASNMADGDFLITGCSFENATYGVFITAAQGAAFGNILLTGNEIAASQYALASFPTSTGNWIRNFLTTGNMFSGKVSVAGVSSGYTNTGNVVI